MPAGATKPALGLCKRLDYELELDILIGSGNASGKLIPMTQTDTHVFGICLLNDWSVRGIHTCEDQPLDQVRALIELTDRWQEPGHAALWRDPQLSGRRRCVGDSRLV